MDAWGQHWDEHDGIPVIHRAFASRRAPGDPTDQHFICGVCQRYITVRERPVRKLKDESQPENTE